MEQHLAADVLHGDLLLCVCAYATFVTLARTILPLNRACRAAALVRLRKVRPLVLHVGHKELTGSVRRLTLRDMDEIACLDLPCRPCPIHTVLGDTGLVSLSGAFSSGALANLKTLNLTDNQIGDVGIQALSTALAGGALAQLTELSLFSNKIGDPGVAALASACASGALAQCQKLVLAENKIGDPGIASLADACARGALPALANLLLFGNPASKEVKQAAQDAIKSHQ